MSKKRFCELKIKSAYLYLVDGVDDDDDVPLVAGGQSLQPAGKLLQDLTGLHRQAGNRPEVLQQLRAHREAFFREQERRARGWGWGGGGARREASHFDREPLDDEDRLRTGGEGPSYEVKEEECAGGLLLLLLDPKG